MVPSPYDSRAAYASATLRPRTRASSAAASSGCQARAVTLTAIVTRPPPPPGPPPGTRARAGAWGGGGGGGVPHGRRVLHERRPRRRRGRLGQGRSELGVEVGRKGSQRLVEIILGALLRLGAGATGRRVGVDDLEHDRILAAGHVVDGVRGDVARLSRSHGFHPARGASRGDPRAPG